MHHHQAMARELEDMKKEHFDCRLPSGSRFTNFFCSATRAKVRELEKALDRANSDGLAMQERWHTTHRYLERTELVLQEQRDYMKAKIDALHHTNRKFAAVRGKLKATERVLKDRETSNAVLRQNNRDLLLEITCLRHRTPHPTSIRNFTV